MKHGLWGMKRIASRCVFVVFDRISASFASSNRLPLPVYLLLRFMVAREEAVTHTYTIPLKSARAFPGLLRRLHYTVLRSNMQPILVYMPKWPQAPQICNRYYPTAAKSSVRMMPRLLFVLFFVVVLRYLSCLLPEQRTLPQPKNRRPCLNDSPSSRFLLCFLVFFF